MEKLDFFFERLKWMNKMDLNGIGKHDRRMKLKNEMLE